MSKQPGCAGITRILTVVVVSVVVAAGFVGCAGVQKATAPVRTVPERAEPIIAQAPSTYGQRAAIVAEDDAQKQALAAFAAGLPTSSPAQIVHDPALDDLARVTALIVGLHEMGPAEPLTAWLHTRLGIIGTPRGSSTMWVTGPSVMPALEDHARQAAAAAPTSGRVAWGIARVNLWGNRWAQVVTWADATIELSPIEKQRPPATPLSLSGTIHGVVHKATLYVDDDDVRVREVPLTVGADGHFVVETDGPRTAGIRSIEIMVQRSAPVDGDQPWSESLGVLPFFVGVPEPAAPGPAITSPPPNPADRSTWEATVLATYNAVRATLDVAPLQRQPAGDALAAELAREHLAQQQSLQVGQRLEAAGVKARSYMAQRGRFLTIHEAAASRLRSPGFRKALISAEMREVSFAFVDDGEGSVEAVEIVIEPAR